MTVSVWSNRSLTWPGRPLRSRPKFCRRPERLIQLARLPAVRHRQTGDDSPAGDSPMLPDRDQNSLVLIPRTQRVIVFHPVCLIARRRCRVCVRRGAETVASSVTDCLRHPVSVAPGRSPGLYCKLCPGVGIFGAIWESGAGPFRLVLCFCGRDMILNALALADKVQAAVNRRKAS